MKYVPKVVSRKASMALLKTRKNSPTLLFVGGVVGVVATTILASKATLELEEVLKTAELDRESAGKLLEDTQKPAYDHEKYDKDMRYITFRTGRDVVKLYAPAAAVGIVSIAALAGSHNILTRRNAALTAAYTSLERGFNEYRKRVVDDLGEDKDREFLYGTEESTVLVEGKNGTKEKKVLTPGGESVYSKWFTEKNQNWRHNTEYNLTFLQGVQNMATHRLTANGYLLLNDVYEHLGMERTREGCVVGWVLGNGDNFVDLGVFDRDSNRVKPDALKHPDGDIMLDFNVDGLVYDLLESNSGS